MSLRSSLQAETRFDPARHVLDGGIGLGRGTGHELEDVLHVRILVDFDLDVGLARALRNATTVIQ